MSVSPELQWSMTPLPYIEYKEKRDLEKEMGTTDFR